MSTTANGGGQTCPNCGYQNSEAAAYCAECGTRLESSNTDTQATTAFSPVDTTGTATSDPAATWGTNDGAYETQEFAPQAPAGADHGSRATADWYPTPVPVHRSAPESRRGFLLGVIAMILILLVIGFLAWSTLVSDGFRDSVTGIF